MEGMHEDYYQLMEQTNSKYDMSDAIIQRNMDQSILCQPQHLNSSGFLQYHRDIMTTQQVNSGSNGAPMLQANKSDNQVNRFQSMTSPDADHN